MKYEVDKNTTVRSVAYLYGPTQTVSDTDPAETFHEASKNSRFAGFRTTWGLQLLKADERLRSSVGRSALRHPHSETIPLPPAELPRTPLVSALRARQSVRHFKAENLCLEELSSILCAAYGLSGQPVERRFVPSGGALYPLEIYVAVRNVSGLQPGLFHYDPFKHSLEVVGGADRLEKICDSIVTPDTNLASAAPFLVIVAGVFWRTRFKYGLRGYRFALLEAGHLMQNALLTAAALGIGALPLGGFLDRPVDAAIGADGADESALYMAAFGRADD